MPDSVNDPRVSRQRAERLARWIHSGMPEYEARALGLRVDEMLAGTTLPREARTVLADPALTPDTASALAGFGDEMKIVRAKWALDGARTLNEAAQKVRTFADYLQTLHNEGWVLAGPITGDYGYCHRQDADDAPTPE